MLPPAEPRTSIVWIVFFSVLVIVHLVGVWSASYFPSQDGLAHLVNSGPAPNGVGHLLLAGLMTVFSPATADKLVVSGYLVLLPLAMLYALRSIDRRAGWAVVLVFPLMYHSLLLIGFYNSCYGMGLYLISVGYWLRRRHHLRWRRDVTVLAALMMLTCFCHLFCLVALWVTVAGFIAASTIANLVRVHREEITWRKFDRRLRHKVLRTLTAAAPTLALMLTLAVWQSEHVAASGSKVVQETSQHAAAADPMAAGRDWAGVLWVSFSQTQRGPAMAYMVILGFVFASFLAIKVARRQFDRNDVLLALIVLFVIVALAATGARARAFLVRPQAELLAWLLVILWIGPQRAGTWTRGIIGLLAVAISLVSLDVRRAQHVRVSRHIEKYLATAEHIETDAAARKLETGLRVGEWRGGCI